MSMEADPRKLGGPVAPASNFAFGQHLERFNIPLATFLSPRPHLDAIAVGAFVAAPPQGAAGHRLLLIQRSTSDSFPSLWEIPGGACDLEDSTILCGLARELWEETGLLLQEVHHTVSLGVGFEGNVKEGGAYFVTPRGTRVIKFSFLIQVQQPVEIKLDPDEHQRYLWVTEAEYKARRCGETELYITTKQQAASILECFRLLREGHQMNGVNGASNGEVET